MEQWILQEFETISLGDKRLNYRAQSILSKLSSQPMSSIPEACGGWAETKAAYRFFENSKVNSENILSAHKKCTLNRIKKYNRVLLLQDTTELDYLGQKQKQGVGPSKNDNNKTLFLHPSLIVTPERVCLGVYDDYQWHRKELCRHTGTKAQHNNARMHRLHISEKESYRWVNGYNKATEIAKLCHDTHVVMISDRESDIYDLYSAADKIKGVKADWLVRINKNRLLLNSHGKREHSKLFDYVQNLNPCQTIEFKLPKRNGDPGRKVKQEIKIAKIKLHPPTGRRGKLRLDPVEVTVLLAQEINPPKGEKPIVWWLMTNIMLANDIEPADLISWYLCRWQIEIFFRILKSGCKVESLQLTTENRTKACLALYMIVAWRILFLTSVARANPNQSCSDILEHAEWSTAYISIKKTKIPKKPPTLEIAINLIAQMGGYLARKNDSPPGPKAIWQGITKLYDILNFTNNIAHFKTYG